MQTASPLMNEFNQVTISKKIDLNIGESTCRSLVVYWLLSIVKKDEDKFWKWLEQIKNDLIDEMPMREPFGDSIVLQNVYEKSANAKGLTIPIDTFTYDTLKQNNLLLDVKDSSQSSQGFANWVRKSDIAQKVITSNNQYFILTIRGVKDGGLINHTIGITREHTMLTKNQKVYIFDPNSGRYETTGSDGVENCLQKLYKENSYQVLNRSYVLRSFIHKN